MSSKHWMVVLAAAVLAVCACDDLTLFRAGSEYFPLIQDSRWTYSDGLVTLTDSVAGDSVTDGRNVIVVLRSFAPEFWLRDQTGAWRFIRRTIIRGGQEYELEAQYEQEYQLPLVLGATWAGTFSDTVTVMGTESLFVRDSLSGRVAAIEDITTPAGTFAECYRIEFFRSVRTDTLAETAWTEWLAPGVGLVKRLTGTDSLVLVDYRLGP